MDLRLKTSRTRVATEAQIRALLGYPRKGDDEDFYESVKSYIGKDYQGGDLPKADFNVIWENHNKDVYAKQDALAKRREAAVAQAKADREAGIATYKQIEERLADPNWRNMDQIAKALGLRDIASAFGMLQNHRVEPIKLGVDGRYVQPGSGVRYGLWAETLDKLVADIGEEAAEYQQKQDAEFKRALAQAEKAKAEGRAWLKEQARLKDEKHDEERAKVQEYNARLFDEKQSEQRHQASVGFAKRRLKQSEYELSVAQEQLDSLASPEARAAFRQAQQERHHPGGGGYTWDRRGRAPTEEEAKAVILRIIDSVDGWESTLKLRESRIPMYRMHDRSVDILLAAEDYPDDTSNRYYWTKKGMPKLEAFRKWTNIMVTRRERNEIYEWPDIVKETD